MIMYEASSSLPLTDVPNVSAQVPPASRPGSVGNALAARRVVVVASSQLAAESAART